MPLLCRVTPPAVHLVMSLSLGVGLCVVVLLLVLMLRVHVRVGLGVLLACCVVGVGSPSLLVVGGVLRGVVEGVNLAVIGVVSRRRHGPADVRLAVVGMAPHAVCTHGSICLTLGVRGHGRVVSGPSLLGLVGVWAESLLLVNPIRRPRFHHVLRRNVCVRRAACRLTRSLISMVRRAGLAW